MHRCIGLARLSAGHVAPNPMVGSVLVYNDRIIGEGYHHHYGGAHAEVSCINSVKDEDKHLIKYSIIYVSLEPCAHFGKTPPCADLIIKHQIHKVVIGCRDPFDQVDGKGIEKLLHAGVEVINGVLESECRELNKRFFTFHTRQRPHIVLKWAQSKNYKIANGDFSRVLISNEYTNRLVHKWRAEETGILIGTNTALHDNPSLNTRNWTGPNPVRLIVDINLRLPQTLQIFNKQQRTIVFNKEKHEQVDNLIFYKIDKAKSLVTSLINACYQLNILSILVEGGATLLKSFINEIAWDEARVIENSEMVIQDGLDAPVLSNHLFETSQCIGADVVSYYRPLQETAQQL